jgi:hypothetical protein
VVKFSQQINDGNTAVIINGVIRDTSNKPSIVAHFYLRTMDQQIWFDVLLLATTAYEN